MDAMKKMLLALLKIMTDLCIVYCTTDSRQNAETIANQLLEQNLAACVQIMPGMTSVYRWDNQYDGLPPHAILRWFE